MQKLGHFLFRMGQMRNRFNQHIRTPNLGPAVQAHCLLSFNEGYSELAPGLIFLEIIQLTWTLLKNLGFRFVHPPLGIHCFAADTRDLHEGIACFVNISPRSLMVWGSHLPL
jgi:hypothetical protein